MPWYADPTGGAYNAFQLPSPYNYCHGTSDLGSVSALGSKDTATPVPSIYTHED